MKRYRLMIPGPIEVISKALRAVTKLLAVYFGRF